MVIHKEREGTMIKFFASSVLFVGALANEPIVCEPITIQLLANIGRSDMKVTLPPQALLSRCRSTAGEKLTLIEPLQGLTVNVGHDAIPQSATFRVKDQSGHTKSSSVNVVW